MSFRGVFELEADSSIWHADPMMSTVSCENSSPLDVVAVAVDDNILHVDPVMVLCGLHRSF